jgi:hypothetical protein
LSFFTIILLTADDGDRFDDVVDPLTAVSGVPGCDFGERAFNLVDVVDGRFAAGLRSSVDDGCLLRRLEGDEAPSVDDWFLLRCLSVDEAIALVERGRLGAPSVDDCVLLRCLAVDEAIALVERGRLGDFDRGVEREALAVVTVVDVFDDSFVA